MEKEIKPEGPIQFEFDIYAAYNLSDYYTQRAIDEYTDGFYIDHPFAEIERKLYGLTREQVYEYGKGTILDAKKRG